MRIDDIGFTKAMIDRLSHETAIDQRAIFATGLSNGAMMCYRLAREVPEIATIAPVAGLLPVGSQDLAWPRPVSVLLIQGMDDPLMPAQGGRVGTARDPRGNVLSLAQAEQQLLAYGHLGGSVARRPMGPRIVSGSDPTSWITRSYSADKAALQIVTITGGGHPWPGGYQYLQKFLIGYACRSLDACDMIWAFFKAHHRTP